MHPATTAAIRSVVTVNTFLFREANWISVVLDGLYGLLNRSGGKGPAGSAPALALNVAQELCCPPVFVVALEVSTTTEAGRRESASTTWHHAAGSAITHIIGIIRHLDALHRSELLVSQVGCRVKSEDGIGFVLLETLYYSLIFLPDANTVGQFLRVSVVLVVGSNEAHEFSFILTW